MKKRFGHMDRYVGCAPLETDDELYDERSPLFLVKRQATEPIYRPPPVPGLQPVDRYRKPQSGMEWEERKRREEYMSINIDFSQITHVSGGPRTAETYDTQDRSTPTFDLGRLAGADWMPEFIPADAQGEA